MDGWTDGRTDGCTDINAGGHIILPIRGFDPIVCGRMRCAKLQAA